MDNFKQMCTYIFIYPPDLTSSVSDAVLNVLTHQYKDYLSEEEPNALHEKKQVSHSSIYTI